EGAIFNVIFSPTTVNYYTGRVQFRTSSTIDPISYISLFGHGSSSIIDEDGDGYSIADGDCDDERADVFPGAEEICDGLDNDCDTEVPPEERDIDLDGWLICAGDCNDQDSLIYPGAEEICDDEDSDCNGIVEDLLDNDGDGQSACYGDCDDNEPEAYAGGLEICDYIDNNCNGRIDEIDEDGDGYSVCPSGGDCNDADPLAYPVFFDSNASGIGDGSVASPYTELSRALENLDDLCKRVVVAEGVHEVDIGWAGGLVQMVGGAPYPEDVTIKPFPSSLRSFRIYEDSTLYLEKLTLFGGDTSEPGSMAYVDGGGLELDNVVVFDNLSAANGGAIYVENGDLQIRDSAFSYNVSNGLGGAIYIKNSTFESIDSSYTANESLSGGAIYMENVQAEMDGVYFKSNDASENGGGLYAGESSVLSISRSRFVNNEAAQRGGGLFVHDYGNDPYIIHNSRFQGNRSDEDGGAIAMTGAGAVGILANNTLVDNAALGAGSAVFIDVDSSAGGNWMWANIFAYGTVNSMISLTESAGGSVGFSMCFPVAGDCFSIPESANFGLNQVGDPLFQNFIDDGNPAGDNFQLMPNSPAIDAGPPEGAGPEFFNSWNDADASQNDLGYTGGPGAEN
ncbi:MAG: MopE-related protein, partial [Myxococcota bacterium]|nr:MopE-related protein [Myxococcota bacterium]